MPELPEVESLAQVLREHMVGRSIDKVELHSLSALKTFDPPLQALEGRPVTGTSRAGKHLLVDADSLWLVVHLSRSGWVRWRHDIPRAVKPVGPKKGPLALRVRLDDGSGFEVTEQATEKRVSIHVVSDPNDVDAVARLGPDPLDDAFDVDALRLALAKHGGQVKGALTDQEVMAGVGNAYSDEALHVARLSPFKKASKLTDDEVSRLHGALRAVLSDALRRSEGLAAKDLKSEKKSGMRVHGRKGEPCPECGDTVREVSFATTFLNYCPTCQTGGKVLADRRLSRLLK